MCSKELTIRRNISKALDTWSIAKTEISAWRKHGTAVTSLRTGCPFKIDEKTGERMVREVAKRLTSRLKELKQFLPSTACSQYVSNLHASVLWVTSKLLKSGGIMCYGLIAKS